MTPKRATRKRHPRAAWSGFARQLDAYLQGNESAERAGRPSGGPSTAAAFAERMNLEMRAEIQARAIKPVRANTVRTWRNGTNLPGSAYVRAIVEIVGAPWEYLDDPEFPTVDQPTRDFFAEFRREVERFLAARKPSPGVRRGA